VYAAASPPAATPLTLIPVQFNIYNDPDAAKIVFESGIDLTMVGLDVTLKPKLPLWVVEKVKQIDTPFGKLVSMIFDFMQRRKAEIGGDDPNLHDVIALASIVTSNILMFKDFYMTVETQGTITRGMTIADFNNVEEKTPNVHAAVNINVDRFWEWFVANLQK
jgi:inosine-uridine nucleoside N-ribohydrolase